MKDLGYSHECSQTTWGGSSGLHSSCGPSGHSSLSHTMATPWPHWRAEQTMVGPRLSTGRSSGKWYKIEMA